jgi:mycothiol synthase
VDGDDRLLGVAVVSSVWLRILAVLPATRRRGIGGALLAAAERVARGGGATRLRVSDQPGNYLTPGVDARDGETRAFLEGRGFVAVGRNENLVAPLTGNPLVTPERASALVQAASGRGYAIRRAGIADSGPLASLAGEFSPAWKLEAGLALQNQPPTVHLAITEGRPVAFACTDGNNRGLGWFGPAGTMPAHRGRGLGEALLVSGLRDVADAGHAEATIAWIGPRTFYERACGARFGRDFVVLEKELPP